MHKIRHLSQEIHKKKIEKRRNLRYNYCVKLFIQSDPGFVPAGEMRLQYGKKSRNSLPRHSLPHYS